MTAEQPPEPRAPAARITLLTDFGTADGYVGAMHGVIASIAPGAIIDDAGHDLPRGDIPVAAWSLASYWDLFPAGTVHVVVVDPGVGTDRRALAAEADGRYIVAPDNGCISHVAVRAGQFRAHAIENAGYMRQPVSATFHGRDIFAPVAAHLALGVRLDTFGPELADPVILPLSRPAQTGGAALGAVIHVDRFGNLITNIPEAWARGAIEVELDGRGVGRLRPAYGAVQPGEPVAVIGSSGFLEIAVRDGSAAAELSAGRESPVRVLRSGPSVDPHETDQDEADRRRSS